MSNPFYQEFDFERRELQKSSAEEDYRSPFQLDRDRIIYTSAFRRLQAKTQVFLSGEYDFYRTRLTHSIEVAQIGRSIVSWLRGRAPFAADFGPDSDLVEAVCLAHDLGHPPFGHAGERTLHRLMRERYGGFEGNAQSLRIVSERIYSSGDRRRGMNPTRAFVDGILKYKSLRTSMGDPENHFVYDGQREWIQFALAGVDTGLQPGDSLNGFRSLECEIMDWADDTAYSLNDVVDGVNAGFLDLGNVQRWAEEHARDAEEQLHLEALLKAIRERKTESAFGRKVGRFIQATSVVERTNVLSARSNRYRFGLVIAPTLRAEVELYKRLAIDLVFRSSKIQQLEYKGDYLLSRIFRAFEREYVEQAGGHVRLLPAAAEAEIAAQKDPAMRARLVCDYVAGMTDGFAVRTYKRLFDPEFGSVWDLG